MIRVLDQYVVKGLKWNIQVVCTTPAVRAVFVTDTYIYVLFSKYS